MKLTNTARNILFSITLSLFAAACGGPIGEEAAPTSATEKQALESGFVPQATAVFTVSAEPQPDGDPAIGRADKNCPRGGAVCIHSGLVLTCICRNQFDDQPVFDRDLGHSIRPVDHR